MRGSAAPGMRAAAYLEDNHDGGVFLVGFTGLEGMKRREMVTRTREVVGMASSVIEE